MFTPQSLERMVLAYVADRPAVLPDIVPNEVAGQVAAGDISVIMRSYEDGLRTPIKAIVFGMRGDDDARSLSDAKA